MTPDLARRVAPVLALVTIAACSTPQGDVDLDAPEVAAALASIEAQTVEHHIGVLAHDSLKGRAPGTAGFAGAARYVEERVRAMGLQPAGVDGTYRQPVPLRRATVVESASAMTVETPVATTPLTYDADFYLGADPMRETVDVSSAGVVFVGFGVSAPDLGYDDYADIDVDGRVVLFLSGAPSAFPSNERAYYSSGATKGAEALARGAVGTMTFWAPDDPRLRWDVNAARAKRGSFAWLDGNGTPNRGEEQMRVSASLNHSAVAALFAASPTPVDSAVARAARSEAQAFNLPAAVTVTTTTVHEGVDSWNVLAKLEGSDPTLSAEHVTYVAHIDHFGVGVTVDGDSIYNGAHDNASGAAIVLEIAEAYASMPAAPDRSILFLFVTAEEWGLLGTDYFVHNPTVPQSSIVANFSLDMPFLFHPLLDIVPYGADHSSMGQSVAVAAAHMGLGIGPDPIPEQVLFIRSDHFAFIRQGIPALFIKSGFETGDPALDGGAINTGFRQERYHTPFDEVEQGFDYEAGADHARINFLTGYLIAETEARPAWNEGDFFGGLFGGG
ncbi:MAG: M28 family peptidase [Gemmatimonadetes bacterium]|nr:M28 family peptidase [Gemmatimonadota bacterium]